MAQPQEFEQVTYNSPDGAQICRTSTDRVSFYGQTPVVRITVSTSDVSTTTATTSSAIFGFASAAEMQNLIIAVSTMQAQMKLMGLLP